MKIVWKVEDGYVGKSRPHFFEIDDDELADHEEGEERNEFITDCVQEEFDQNVSFGWEKA